MKPELKIEDGKIVATAHVGVDTDKDGINALGVEVKVYIDAKEAVTELVKKETPQWLKDLVNKISPKAE